MTYNNYIKVYESQLEEGWLKWGKAKFNSYNEFCNHCYELFKDSEWD